MAKKKILEIGPYPPPETGWSVRIKQLESNIERTGNTCRVLNIGSNRKIKSEHYLDVQGGLDYLFKLIYFRFKGFRFHIHGNAQAVKGPVLCLVAHLVATLTFKRAVMTFHGGYNQLYFPKKNATKMYWTIYVNFLLSKKIICNDKTIKKLICEYGYLLNPKKIYPIQAFSTQYLAYQQVSLPAKIEKFISDKKHTVLSYIAIRHGYHLEPLTEYITKASKTIAFIITGAGKVEDPNMEGIYQNLVQLEKNGKILIVPSLSHDEFMCLLEKTDVYLRTHYNDGVSSSVLEALASGAVVVACENFQRPKGVITYEPDSVQDLHQKMDLVLDNLSYYKSIVEKPEIIDTVQEEIQVLFDEK